MAARQSTVGRFKVLEFGNGQLVAGLARVDDTIIDVHQAVVTAFGNQHLHYANHVIEYKLNEGIAVTFTRLGQAYDENHEVEVRIAVTPGFRRLVMPGIIERRPKWVGPAEAFTDDAQAAVVAAYAFTTDRPHVERIEYCTNPISKTLGVTARHTLVSFPETGQPAEPEAMADYVGFYLDGKRPQVAHETHRFRLPTLTPLPLAPSDSTVFELPRLTFDATTGNDRDLSRLYYLESIIQAGWEKMKQCLADAGLEMVQVQ
ncbi:hypothetical protein QKT49_gp097 [Acanthamoeba castellanii medusavirus]|uniref:Uncharacterized protein n=1 Tax=Acanthamoeba castellanii medusavirus J1 TaxID=3114988 RepID=A0A3T1CWM4_9VIRU|nr:hypothetical protein QKT49_gp097 [Acanthamoeba castellanii medusavirus]BBI30237.1 hypothetical protein [Acanthamoeba castellanii medusavirus J1]